MVEAVRTPAGDVSLGDPIEFKATATDPDGDTLTYEWDFGDGAKANTATAIHAYTTPGVWYAKVTVTDGKGGKTEKLLQVAVQPNNDNEETVGVGGLVPGTMALDITGSANLGVFVPGVARDYTASLSATATSTAAAAVLTVYDKSTTATGRLVNGSSALASPVQVNADGGEYKPVVGRPAPDDAGEVDRPVQRQDGDDRLQAVDRGQRAAGHGRVRQDADVHALADHAVVT